MKEKQKQVIEMYAKGFRQVEIAKTLNINQSTVSRYLTNPSPKEIEDFYENKPYGAYYTKDGEKVLFNRRYKPLNDKTRWVEGVIKQEWYYSDGTWWDERFWRSENLDPIYESIRKKS
jgi:hypothetical protein